MLSCHCNAGYDVIMHYDDVIIVNVKCLRLCGASFADVYPQCHYDVIMTSWCQL